MEKYHHTAFVSFDTIAVIGDEINGKIYLTNGRHRCFVAKKLNIPVPIYIESKSVVKKVQDIVSIDKPFYVKHSDNLNDS